MSNFSNESLSNKSFFQMKVNQQMILLVSCYNNKKKQKTKVMMK